MLRANAADWRNATRTGAMDVRRTTGSGRFHFVRRPRRQTLLIDSRRSATSQSRPVVEAVSRRDGLATESWRTAFRSHRTAGLRCWVRPRRQPVERLAARAGQIARRTEHRSGTGPVRSSGSDVPEGSPSGTATHARSDGVDQSSERPLVFQEAEVLRRDDTCRQSPGRVLSVN